jgi:hypothetical protein
VKSMRWMMVACLLGAALAWGCTPPAGDKKGDGEKKAKEKEKDDGHEHHDPGPNGGGAVQDFGKDNKYHVEVVFDRDKKEATIYVLGPDEKKAQPIKSEKLTLTLKEPDVRVECRPMPRDGEKDGTSSRFVGKDDKLGGKGAFTLDTVNGEIAGKPYVAEYKGEKVEAKK